MILYYPRDYLRKYFWQYGEWLSIGIFAVT